MVKHMNKTQLHWTEYRKNENYEKCRKRPVKDDNGNVLFEKPGYYESIVSLSRRFHDFLKGMDDGR